MFPLRNFVVYSLVAVGTMGFINVAQADTVNLVGGWNVIWNVQSYPASPSVAIQIENAASSSDQIFNGYDLGLKFQLVSGSGQVAVAGASNPSTNSVVPAWLESTPRAGLNAGTMVLDNNALSDTLDYTVSDVPTDLLTVDFGPGGIAPAPGSVFDVWSDHIWSDYFDHTGTNVTQYANNATTDFLLGTITVVPEPGSLALLAAAAIGIAIGYARRTMISRSANNL